MPLPRFHKLDPDFQKKILEEATREFAARGFAEASLNRILLGAGVSKGAMYYYFADKADLYSTVVERALSRLAQATGEPPSYTDAAGYWSAIAVLFERVTAFLLAEPELAALGREVYRNAGGALDALLGRARAVVHRWLADGQRVGAVRRDLPLELLSEAAAGMLIAIDRWFAEHWAELDPSELSALSLGTLELCRDLLSPKGALE